MSGVTLTRQLRRLRWAVRAVLTLALAASVSANVLHAQPNPISQVISAWPPLALLLAIELIGRVPLTRRIRAVLIWCAAGMIAGIAAWVSYWHMVAVTRHYGETDAAPYLLPLSVDGLVIIASVYLVELNGRIRSLPASGPTKLGSTPIRATSGLTLEPRPDTGQATERPTPAPAKAPTEPKTAPPGRVLAPERETPPGGAGTGGRVEPDESAHMEITVSDPDTTPTGPDATPTPPDTPRRASASQAPLVLDGHARYPGLTNQALADRLGLSLSTVNRYRPKKGTARANGHAVLPVPED